MSKNRSIRRSESCGHFDQPKYNTLSTNEQINVVEVRDQNVTNSEALSSCESPKRSSRKHRFRFGSQHCSLRKRAFSSIMSNKNAFSLDGNLNQQDFNYKPPGSIHDRNRNISQITYPEQNLENSNDISHSNESKPKITY